MDIIKELKKRGIVAVLEIEDPKDAIPCAKALLDGGISAIELALRTEGALKAIENIKREVPQMLVGVGTVIFKEQLDQVKKIGADFAVAPGLNENIVKYAKEINFPFYPGVSTASEIEKAISLDYKFLKLFPAGPLGGVKYLNAVAAPYKYLNIQYFPLGGITYESMKEWAELSNVVTIGGSWIAKRDLIKANDWSKITELAKQASTQWKSLKEGR